MTLRHLFVEKYLLSKPAQICSNQPSPQFLHTFLALSTRLCTLNLAPGGRCRRWGDRRRVWGPKQERAKKSSVEKSKHRCQRYCRAKASQWGGQDRSRWLVVVDVVYVVDHSFECLSISVSPNPPNPRVPAFLRLDRFPGPLSLWSPVNGFRFRLPRHFLLQRCQN